VSEQQWKLNEQQWKELRARQQQWQKRQQRLARIEKSRLYWVFDPRLEETHRIRARETKQAYRRMRIRYFFSWEGLSKFLLAPVFNISLTSVIITPFIAHVWIALRETFGSFFGHMFPIHMGLLFLSGLSVVIARIIYELFCPKLVKAYINPTSLDTQHLQNQEWLQVELEYCLLQYVYSLPTTEEYLKRKQIVKMRDTMTDNTGEPVSSLWASVPEFPGLRIGFDAYGVWLIQNLLWRIARQKQRKMFARWGVKESFGECTGPQEVFTSGYHDLFFIIFEIAGKYETEKKEAINQGDFLISVHGSNDNYLEYSSKDARIHDYFSGVEMIAGLGANDIVKEFIAENENYWKPLIRIIIGIVLFFSLLSLLGFLTIQTRAVWNAILS
jgi:hypothetical protein